MPDRIPSLLRACSDAGLDPLREMAGFGAGVAAIFIVLGANAAFGATALSSASLIEPASQSRPYGLQSTFAGEN